MKMYSRVFNNTEGEINTGDQKYICNVYEGSVSIFDNYYTETMDWARKSCSYYAVIVRNTREYLYIHVVYIYTQENDVTTNFWVELQNGAHIISPCHVLYAKTIINYDAAVYPLHREYLSSKLFALRLHFNVRVTFFEQGHSKVG